MDEAPSPASVSPTLAGGCDVILTLGSMTHPPCGALSFDVFRGASQIATGLLAGPWTDTVPENGIWCYRVRSACGTATSQPGDAECVFVDGCGGPPARPSEALFDPTSAVKGSPGTEDLTWTWSPAVGALFYRVYRGELGIGGPTLPHASPFSTCTGDPPPECRVDGLSFTDCGVLGDGHAYYYLAIGVSAAGTEGLYGDDSNGFERAPGISNCP